MLDFIANLKTFSLGLFPTLLTFLHFQGLQHLIRGQVGKDKDLFELPELPVKDENEFESDESSDSETDMILERVGLKNVHDVYQVDVDSPQFGCLPKHVQYEVLNDLKGKKKQNSWATMHQMPREAENFSAFQFERLKRRRQIEAKLTNVKDDLSKSQMEMTDSKLFVGDKAGLKKMKTETRRMASRPDKGIVFMSGLSQTNDDIGEGSSSGEPSKKLVRKDEVRELFSSDDEDLDKAIALSLSAEGPSQEEILDSFKREPNESFDDDDDDDDIILLPTPSLALQSSSRIGGTGLLVIKEEIEEIKDKDIIEDNVGTISDSSDETDDFEEVEEASVKSEEDLFADVFEHKADVNKLEEIITKPNIVKEVKESNRNNSDADKVLDRLSRLDKPSDIFADIASRAAKKKVAPIVAENKDKSKTSFTKEVSDNLRNGPGIMMKIASKWADAEVKKVSIEEESENSDVDSPDDIDNTFDQEQDKLVHEMEKVEKENRLLKFTQPEALKTNPSLKTTSNESLNLVKPKTILNTTLSERIMSQLPEKPDQIKENSTDDKIYMAPVAGFVPGGRNIDKDKIVIQPDDDEVIMNDDINDNDETARDVLEDQELLALQERLAAEQNSLVAELGKANRLSNSITDQMYADCQVRSFFHFSVAKATLESLMSVRPKLKPL